MNAEAIEQLSPLARDLRAQNPDRYLAVLFAPAACRRSLIALFAFDHEIARAQRTVREPMAGLIRLQWWQDVIERFSQPGAVAHPVVRELQRAVNEKGLDKICLERAIEGRRRPLEDNGPPDPEAFEQHLLDVGGSISCAASELLGGTEPEVLAVANRVGLVSAALDQLRFLQKPGADFKAWLPTTWFGEANKETADSPYAGFRKYLVGRALTALAEARRQKASIPRSTLPAFFPGTLAGVRLRDPACERDLRPLPTAVPRLIWCWMRRRF